MKRTIIIAIAFVCCALGFAQQDTEASYTEGKDALMSTIYGQLRYPKECMEQDIQGTVVVKVQILKSGNVGKVTVVSSPHKLMSSEVLNCVKQLSGWTPATKNGKKVDSEVELPVTFRLSSAPIKQEEASQQDAADGYVEWHEVPMTIETFAANHHETEWYGSQARAWQKVVDENPKDEWAWRNLFRATYYYDSFTGGFRQDQDSSRTADVLRRMEAELPGSFVVNLCKCRFCLTTDEDAHTSKYIVAAIAKMPGNVCAEDVNYLANRLWAFAPDSKEVSELNRLTYRNKYFPERVLRYNWNMLRSMEQGGLYFSNGDNLTSPMKLLQDAMGERKDVCVIPISFLHLDSFRDALCHRLGIQPIRRDINDYADYKGDWTKQFYADIIMYLIRQSKRPAYFSTDMLSFTNLDKDSLYNEGMLLKYSDKPYDNFAVAMHNVKEVYHLEYLTEPDIIYNDWETSNRMDMNYVTLLSHLVSKLRNRGEAAEARRLYGILEKCAERSAIDPELKAMIVETLEKEK